MENRNPGENGKQSINQMSLEGNQEDDWKSFIPEKVPQIVGDADENGIIVCKVDQTPVSFLIDSGSPINAVTIEDWEKIRTEKCFIHHFKKGGARELKGYASDKPLVIVGTFQAKLSVNDQKPSEVAEFFIIQGAKRSLLSKSTQNPESGFSGAHDRLTKSSAISKVPKHPSED